MKKIRLLNWLLVASTALFFTSCNDEPLTGEFIQTGGPTEIEEGQFRAQIDGVEFIANFVNATLTPENLLVISGAIDTTGEIITLTVADAAVGSFDLITSIGNAVLNIILLLRRSIHILQLVSLQGQVN